MQKWIFLGLFLFSFTEFVLAQDTVIQAPTKIIITKIEIKSYPGLDVKGNPWDVATIHPDILLQFMYFSHLWANIILPVLLKKAI